MTNKRTKYSCNRSPHISTCLKIWKAIGFDQFSCQSLHLTSPLSNFHNVAMLNEPPSRSVPTKAQSFVSWTEAYHISIIDSLSADKPNIVWFLINNIVCDQCTYVLHQITDAIDKLIRILCDAEISKRLQTGLHRLFRNLDPTEKLFQSYF